MTGVALTRTGTALALALGGSGGRHLVRPRTAALLVAFLPAHLHTFRVVPRRALPMTVAAVRLPLQVPLIRVALHVARRG